MKHGQALRTEELQGLDGSGWLRGEYVDVTQRRLRSAAAYSPGGDFRIARTTRGFKR